MKKLLGSILTLALFCAVFTLKADAASLRVVYPNGGESFKTGQKIIVKWSSSDLPKADELDVRLANEDTGELYAQLGGIANTGSHEMNIRPDIPAGNYRLFVHYLNDYKDYSDGTFTIAYQDYSNSAVSYPATNVKVFSAQLNGAYSAVPYFNAVFEYSKTPSFAKPLSQAVPVTDPQGKLTDISTPIYDLSQNTTYYYRLCFYTPTTIKFCGNISKFKTYPLFVAKLKNPYTAPGPVGSPTYNLVKKTVSTSGKMTYYQIYNNTSSYDLYNENGQIYYNPKALVGKIRFGAYAADTTASFIKSTNAEIKKKGYIVLQHFMDGGPDNEDFTAVELR